jgi:hypothetical protein
MTPEQRNYILKTLDQYWPDNTQIIEKVPIAHKNIPKNEELPPQGVMVEIPEWANDIAIDGGLLVPKWASNQASKSWMDTDWVAVCFWYINNIAERAYEEKHGPIHSYSLRLKGWDNRFWEHAWVNRIALFLRRWASYINKRTEEELFGRLPKPEILITHDVDAVKKTMAIRFKQTAFHCFNAFRALFKLKPTLAFRKFHSAIKFFFSRDDYWCFEKIKDIEINNEIRSHFNFYAGPTGHKRKLHQQLIDPAYDIFDERLVREITSLNDGGWTIGLHQAFDTWKDAEYMVKEKEKLELVLGVHVKTCRQHWLRFSFKETWETQQKAGFELDTTLGFNDRPAFRNGTALTFHPWCNGMPSPLNLAATPMVFMDSHFYDYQELSEEQRRKEIKRWFDEIRIVHGSATIIWHQHVINNDYGWEHGYIDMIREYSTSY